MMFPTTSTLKSVASLSAAFAAGAALSHYYTAHRLRALPPPESPSLPPTALLAGVELGGTSCRAAVAYADKPTDIVDIVEFDTIDPHSTVGELIRFLRRHVPFAALGVASFGPIDLDPASETYGYITTTPKPGWQNFDLLGAFKEFDVPVGFDTDVNAPALAELRYGGHGDLDSCAYITVGTGIGVGLVVNRKPVHGVMHPEGGQIMVLRKEGDVYEGWAKVHKKSAESMASARACAERMGVETGELRAVDDGHEGWDDVAYYLAQVCLTVTYVACPMVIVMSGGVMKRKVLFEKIREWFVKLNEGYVGVERVRKVEGFIVPSKFGNEIGIIGAVELARRAVLGEG